MSPWAATFSTPRRTSLQQTFDSFSLGRAHQWAPQSPTRTSQGQEIQANLISLFGPARPCIEDGPVSLAGQKHVIDHVNHTVALNNVVGCEVGGPTILIHHHDVRRPVHLEREFAS